MYHHYHSAFLNDNDFDRMFAEADAEEQTPNRAPRYVIIEAAVDERESNQLPEDADAEATDDEVIDRSVDFVLEYLAHTSRDDLPRGVGLRDIWDAVQATGLVLGTVFESPGRGDKVVELITTPALTPSPGQWSRICPNGSPPAIASCCSSSWSVERDGLSFGDS